MDWKELEFIFSGKELESGTELIRHFDYQANSPEEQANIKLVESVIESDDFKPFVPGLMRFITRLVHLHFKFERCRAPYTYESTDSTTSFLDNSFKIPVTFHNWNIDHIPEASTCTKEFQLPSQPYNAVEDAQGHVFKMLRICAEYSTCFGMS